MKKIPYIIITDDDRIAPYILNLPEHILIYVRDLTELGMTTSSLINYDKINYVIVSCLDYKPANCVADKLESIRVLPKVYFNLRPSYMDMLWNLKSVMNVPNYLYGNQLSTLLPKLDPKKEYILKVRDQARSVGKVYVTKSKLIEMIHWFMEEQHKPEIKDNKKENKPSFEEEFNIDTSTARGEYEKTIISRVLKNRIDDAVVIQEKVDFTHEFRFLIFKEGEWNTDLDMYTNYYITEYRTGYAPNSKEKRKHTPIDFVKYINNNFANYDKKVRLKLIKDVLSRANDLMLMTNSPAISLDIYLNEKKLLDKNVGYNPNCWGAFEYSTEFGLDYPSNVSEQITEYYTKSYKTWLGLPDNTETNSVKEEKEDYGE